MPTLRNIFKKTFSSTLSSIFKIKDKIFNLFNRILDFELDSDNSKINWLLSLFYLFLLGANIIWFYTIKFVQKDFDYPTLPISIFPIFLGALAFYLSFYYFRHAKNKTKSKGKKYHLIILAFFIILGIITGIIVES